MGIEHYENIYIIDYWEFLGINFLETLCKEYSFEDIVDDEYKNDVILNIYPHEIKPFNLTIAEEAKNAYGFLNWFALKDVNKKYKHYSDFVNNYKVANPEIQILRWLCTLGEIEEGNYLIRVSW